MITQEKLNIYNRYNGNLDLWTLTGQSSEKKIVASNDWYLIDSMIQDIAIIRKGLAAEQFTTNLKNRIRENCDNEETIKLLESISIE